MEKLAEYSRPFTHDCEFAEAGLTKVESQTFVNNTDSPCVIESWRLPSGTYPEMVVPSKAFITRAVAGDKWECGIYLVYNE